MTIYLGGDHRGFDLKEQLEAALLAQGHTVSDLGNTAYEETDDYPIWAQAVAQAVVQDPAARGVLLCGSAEGVCMAANKVHGARAAIGYAQEAIVASRQDEDANILCLPADQLSLETAAPLVQAFLDTAFSGAERHQRRLNQMRQIEEDNSNV